MNISPRNVSERFIQARLPHNAPNRVLVARTDWVDYASIKDAIASITNSIGVPYNVVDADVE